ncbi:MAG: gliding motility lipoprotein GldD [Bacteroidota bacterium]|jgi:gliding motility-associated lipoprotein GldD
MTKAINKKVIIWISGIALIAFGSWYLLFNEPHYLPKPIGFFRIDLPEKMYQDYQTNCDLSFDIATCAKVEMFREQMNSDTCRFNILYPRFNARIHCTYLPVGSRFDQLIDDVVDIAWSHESRMSAIKSKRIQDPGRNVYGVVYDLEGEAASQAQFFLTDSVQHFFRGSLYFYNRPNPDSIAPVLEFIRADIERILQTTRWNNIPQPSANSTVEGANH